MGVVFTVPRCCLWPQNPAGWLSRGQLLMWRWQRNLCSTCDSSAWWQGSVQPWGHSLYDWWLLFCNFPHIKPASLTFYSEFQDFILVLFVRVCYNKLHNSSWFTSKGSITKLNFSPSTDKQFLCIRTKTHKQRSTVPWAYEKGWEMQTPKCVAPPPGRGKKGAGGMHRQGLSDVTINACELLASFMPRTYSHCLL